MYNVIHWSAMPCSARSGCWCIWDEGCKFLAADEGAPVSDTCRSYDLKVVLLRRASL
jgi:hypothetical protein